MWGMEWNWGFGLGARPMATLVQNTVMYVAYHKKLVLVKRIDLNPLYHNGTDGAVPR